MTGLPEITDLQFTILDLIRNGSATGAEIRSGLRDYGDTRSYPAFYQLMGRIEAQGLVDGKTNTKSHMRSYTLTKKGKRQYDDKTEFFARKPVLSGCF